MNKRKYVNLLRIVLPVIILSGLFVYSLSNNSINQNTNYTPNTTNASHADWADHFGDIDSLTKAADIIIKGQVVKSTTEQRVNLIFTKQEVKIKEVYKGNVKNGESIKLLQTGGEMNNIKTAAFVEAPLLDKGGDYLMYLRLTQEGHYLVLGGYQGIGKIENNKVKFNVEEDIIAMEFKDKNLESIDRIVTNKVKSTLPAN